MQYSPSATESSLTCERPGLLRLHFPQVLQVALVSRERNDDALVAVVPQLLQPSLHVIESHLPGDIVDEESTYCTSVVRTGDGPVSLLTSHIPDLGLHGLAIHLGNIHQK